MAVALGHSKHAQARQVIFQSGQEVRVRKIPLAADGWMGP